MSNICVCSLSVCLFKPRVLFNRIWICLHLHLEKRPVPHGPWLHVQFVVTFLIREHTDTEDVEHVESQLVWSQEHSISWLLIIIFTMHHKQLSFTLDSNFLIEQKNCKTIKKYVCCPVHTFPSALMLTLHGCYKAAQHCSNMHFPLFHVWLHPWRSVSVLHSPRGYSGTSAVGGIICHLLFCLFYLTSDGIPLLSKSNNYLDVKTLSIIIISPFPLFALMPVVTVQENRPWISFSSTELSGSITTGVKSVPGDRRTVCLLSGGCEDLSGLRTHITVSNFHLWPVLRCGACLQKQEQETYGCSIIYCFTKDLKSILSLYTHRLEYEKSVLLWIVIY